ncbi:Protein bimA [Escovopsis weberi]|uniref:Protein bimA n=1 Tax=Escovopsis weberi TaxID=150374 RepID=A0A0M9VTF2_ESCWE|nr:Protein bimA [Escovopsis weberi]
MDAMLRIVHAQLDADLNENAAFLAERMQASDPREAAWTHLRALACLRLGRHALAGEVSREMGLAGAHLGCAADERSWRDRFVPDGAAVRRLLGKLHLANGDVKTAAGFLCAALEADPFMWDAFTDLCDSGVRVRVEKVFRLRSGSGAGSRGAAGAGTGAGAGAKKLARPLAQQPGGLGVVKVRRPAADPGRAREPSKLPVQTARRASSKSPPVADENAAAGAAENAANNWRAGGADAMPARRVRSGLAEIRADAAGAGPGASAGGGGGVGAGAGVIRDEHAGRDGELGAALGSSLPLLPQRRSARLLSQGAPGLAGREASRLVAEVTSAAAAAAAAAPQKRLAQVRVPSRQLDPPRAPLSHATTTTTTAAHAKIVIHAVVETEATRADGAAPSPSTDERLQPVMDLLQRLGAGYYHLSRFEPRPCLDALSSLPVAQQATPWVLSKTGRAQYELMSYREARETFQALRRASPAWLEDVEVYSTVLWHLKEDVALAYLAHELSDAHPLAPQAWCAVGNLMSLQRCRGEAVRCFRRACRLSPRLPHSFSLLGYEYMEMEELADARAAFREALGVDARHYSAWVGLGRVQERLGQADKALEYYLGAEKINAQNAVLLTYIARVFDRTGRRDAALSRIRRGIRLDPPGAVVGLLRMQAAGIFLRCGQAAEALRELRLVEEMAADEPRVHFLMGKAYAMLGLEGRGAALRCFTTALSLAPWSDEIRLAMTELGDE